MNLCVYIRKNDLATCENLGALLSHLSRKVMESDDGCRYFPMPGKFVEFMNVLLQHDLDYALEYDEAVP